MRYLRLFPGLAAALSELPLTDRKIITWNTGSSSRFQILSSLIKQDPFPSWPTDTQTMSATFFKEQAPSPRSRVPVRNHLCILQMGLIFLQEFRRSKLAIQDFSSTKLVTQDENTNNNIRWLNKPRYQVCYEQKVLTNGCLPDFRQPYSPTTARNKQALA